jgi:hypothetical protein
VAANAHTSEEIVAALTEYWTGKMAVVWTRADIFGKAWIRGLLLTNEQVDEILDDMLEQHDPENGITWTTIECALDVIDPPYIALLTDAGNSAPDYPGNFRVWWTDNDGVDQFKDFNQNEGRDLFKALAFAAFKATEVDGDVQVCVVDDGGNECPVAYYEIVDGHLIIENAS